MKQVKSLLSILALLISFHSAAQGGSRADSSKTTKDSIQINQKTVDQDRVKVEKKRTMHDSTLVKSETATQDTTQVTQKKETQDSNQKKQKKLEVNGYIKNMASLTFDNIYDNVIAGDLIHNRLNFKWKPSNKITGVMEFRNRLIWGDAVRQNRDFVISLRNRNEAVNLQKIWVADSSLVLLTNTERLYLDLRDKKWNVRLGRQRINWGVTTIWNPNDIFNVYNYFDFDYEERPGADAAKVKYLFNDFSNLELVYASTGQKDASVAALRYSLNKWRYDMHLIAGWYKAYPTIGAGWAGNIKDAGFKGEAQIFIPPVDSSTHLNITMESDYMFKKGWYVNISFLFANYGLDKPIENLQDVVNIQLSPLHLMPTKYNFAFTTSKEFTPLFAGSISIIYAPGTNLLILYPTLQYNIATDWDVSLIWQSFFSQMQHNYLSLSQSGYLRFRWSF